MFFSGKQEGQENMIQDTSMQAFGLNKPDRATMCIRMLSIFRLHGDLTDEEFKKISGWEINQITARRNDLINKKDCYGNAIPDIEEKGRKKNTKNRSVILWGIVSGGQQHEMF